MRKRRVADERRTRLREAIASSFAFLPGRRNAITDVAGVHVGQVTLIKGDDVRTGATAILPHGENLLQERVPAGLAVANGHGKMIGATQIAELGEIETPIVLTNTLAVPRAAEAILDWTLSQSGNEKAVSINPVVGETNDGKLNAIEKRPLTTDHVLRARSGRPLRCHGSDGLRRLDSRRSHGDRQRRCRRCGACRSRG